MTAMEYSATVARRFADPAHVGEPDGPGTQVSGEAGSPARGAWIRFFVRLAPRKILSAGFLVYGCPHTIAACDVVAGRLAGNPPESLRQFTPGELLQELEIPADKTGKILILQDALRACFDDWTTVSGFRDDTDDGDNADRQRC